MRHFSSTIVLGIVFGTAMHAQATDEYKVKAAVLYNFVKFVVWPPRTFKSPADPIVIGVLGKNPFGDALATEAEGKRFENRVFQVRQLSDVQQVPGVPDCVCQCFGAKTLRPAAGAAFNPPAC